MNALAVLLLAVQAVAWAVSPQSITVGDTVRVTRQVPAGPDARSTALPLAGTSAYVPLSAPVAAYSEGALVVQYQLAFFQTGVHRIFMPDLELSYPDGRTDVYQGDTAWVEVGSVLPEDDSRPPPRPSIGPFARTQRSATPVIIIVIVILTGLAAWAALRRRISERPCWAGSAREPGDVPLQQWIMAGESKAAVGVISDRLRDTIERQLPSASRQLSTQECIAVVREAGPDWPTRDIEEVLRSLDRAQYAPAIPSDVALLVDQVEHLVNAIAEQPVEAADT